jgi:hypothetical protein
MAEPDESYQCKQRRVMSTVEWMFEHDGHGRPDKLLHEAQPPKGTYTIYTLLCPCGARHVITEEANK